jgi:hypothetical protein
LELKGKKTGHEENCIGKRPLGRPRHKWEDKIKIDLREMGIDGVSWIQPAQDRVQWQAFSEHSNEPSGSIKKAGYSLTSSVTISFSNNIPHNGVSERLLRISQKGPGRSYNFC